MRILRTTLALLTISGAAAAADATVYLTAEGAVTPYAAKAIAGSVFKKAGVSIAWASKRPDPARTSGIVVYVNLAERTPQERLPGALALSYPYSGCSKGITVFYDRIRSLAPGHEQEASLLAYVLVHEITHVLQGVDHHSPSGVMKAAWSTQDSWSIYERRLPLLEFDIMLIHQGLPKVCRQPGMITARSESGIAVHPE